MSLSKPTAMRTGDETALLPLGPACQKCGDEFQTAPLAMLNSGKIKCLQRSIDKSLHKRKDDFEGRKVQTPLLIERNTKQEGCIFTNTLIHERFLSSRKT